MSTDVLWLPEEQPPLLDPEVAGELTKEIREAGVLAIAAGVESEFDTTQSRVRAYLDEFGFELNGFAYAHWPARVLEVAAALTYLGYKRSGQVVATEGTFDLSREIANIQGVPDAYAVSAVSDPALYTVVTEAFTDPRLKEVEGDGYLQIAGIGAGCMRFYLQEALLAG